MSVVSVTERAIFKECRRKWRYSCKERLEPLRGGYNALWFGRGVHYVLAEYYKMVMKDEVDLESVMKSHEFWLGETTDQEALTFEEKAKLDGLIDLQTDMITRYINHVESNRWDEEWEILAVEENLSVKVPGTRVRLSGTLDLLIRWRGKLWVVDHKTFQTFADPTALELDDQMTAYLWLVKEVYGEVPGGAIYNQLRKKSPVKPRPLVSGKGLSKAKDIDTTREIYLATLLECGFDPRDYVEVLQRIAKNEFFRRETILRDQSQLEMFGEFIPHEVREMTSKSTSLFPHFTTDCSWRCPYLVLCRTESSKGDWQAIADSLYEKVDGRLL